MATYGRTVLTQTGQPIQVAADGQMDWKPGGITIDWATVPAVGADTVLGDGTLLRAGQAGLEYGTILCQIGASGMYGPYNAAATDGRQALQRGQCYILNQTVLQNGANPLVATASDHPAVFDGGLVWKDRLKVGGAGQPAWADVEAAFPRLRYATN